MTSPQRLPTSLTPPDKALDSLLQGVEPVAAIELTLAEALRCVGGDIAAGRLVAEAGRRVLPRDLLMARAAGIGRLKVRRPRLGVVNVPGGAVTADLIAESARTAGADVVLSTAARRDAGSIAAALDDGAYDLLLTIGGSGVGRTDAAVTALAARGKILAHGIALQPGRTSAVGRLNKTPVVVLPGAPDQAVAAWWTLALPVLDRLSGRHQRKTVNLPLARKIASHVGIAEIVLMERKQDMWVTLAVGDLSLGAIARAEAWLAVPAGSEGFAAGRPVDAYMLRD